MHYLAILENAHNFDGLDVGLLVIWFLVILGCLLCKKLFRPGVNPFLVANLETNFDDIYLGEAPIEMPYATENDSKQISELNEQLNEIIRNPVSKSIAEAEVKQTQFFAPEQFSQLSPGSNMYTQSVHLDNPITYQESITHYAGGGYEASIKSQILDIQKMIAQFNDININNISEVLND